MYLNFQEFYSKYFNLDNFFIKEDENIFYLWKKSWIPSSFWKEESVLDFLEKGKLDDDFTKNQLNNFIKEQEYWLLNRLDNDTSWFLYFAKDEEKYNNFKLQQKNNQIEKVYYAMVKTNIENEVLWKNIIDFPIMHKNKTKMMVIKNKNDEKKWRWKKHFVKTNIEFIKKEWDYIWLKVIIKKGIRHQIRVHLASIWYPIIWDRLYNWEDNDRLHLFSVWIV